MYRSFVNKLLIKIRAVNRVPVREKTPVCNLIVIEILNILALGGLYLHC